MPSFDLRYIQIAKRSETESGTAFTERTSIGDAMSCNLELKFAEGRLYAESSLAEFMKLATGGTISIAEKYIPNKAQTMMFGAKDHERTVGSNKKVTSIQYTADDIAEYVGVSFYAPDKIDGVTKFTCVFVPKALFGPPSMSFQTKGESIVFNTPTTTGEFLPDQKSGKLLLDVGVADTEDDAKAWCDLVLGGGA